jgi:signal transduction histidine kinase
MQVVLNILQNSQDNAKEKEIKDPKIEISVWDKRIEIWDNGGGIEAEFIPKIFDPYFSTKHAKIGTGLGLYMSKIIIQEHHKGTLSAQNRDDGVCFTIDLGSVS